MTAQEQAAATRAQTWHYGRSWSGTAIEDGCPCEQAPCGLVIGLKTVGGPCTQHTVIKTIRQSHPADACPGRREAEVLADAAEQADARRARAEHAAVDIRPGSVSDLLRERLGRQVADRAARRGQLGLTGDR